jgi:hypothetical protein
MNILQTLQQTRRRGGGRRNPYDVVTVLLKEFSLALSISMEGQSFHGHGSTMLLCQIHLTKME